MAENNTSNIISLLPNRYSSNSYTKIRIRNSTSNEKDIYYRFPVPQQMTTELSSQSFGSIDAPQFTKNSENFFDITNNGKASMSMSSFIDAITSKNNLEKAGNIIGTNIAEVKYKEWNEATQNGLSILLQKNKNLVYNPNKFLQYGGTDFRDLQLTFYMIPDSQELANKINEAVREIMKASLPGVISRKGTDAYDGVGSSAIGYLELSFLQVPEQFDVEVVINGTKVIKREKLQLENLRPNFTTSSTITWHKDGTPITMTLDMTFKETEIATNSSKNNIWMEKNKKG